MHTMLMGRIQIARVALPRDCPVLQALATGLHDAWSEEKRPALEPYAARIPEAAASAELEQVRAWMAADWLVRVHAPAFLRLAGLEAHAEALASLARISDPVSARSALPVLEAAREAAAEASAPAHRHSAWGAVRAAATAAGREAAGGAAVRPIDDDPDRKAATLTAMYAGFAAALAAGWNASVSASGAPPAETRKVAAAALRPVVVELQAAALVLLEEMVGES